MLVDEFQDTDPLQAEIFGRLCGDPPAGQVDADWESFVLRPGALFLVGIPSRPSIASEAPTFRPICARVMRSGPSSVEDVISISATSILRLDPGLCERAFENILQGAGQPGFTRLDAFTWITTGAPAWRLSTWRWPRPRTNRVRKSSAMPRRTLSPTCATA